MTVPDRVERKIVVDASLERVWAAFTEPDQLTRWFPDEEAHMDLRPGGVARFIWDEAADEAIIDVVDPPERLVFRWRPEGSGRRYTTVAVSLRGLDAGTEVTLVESGFASLPDEIRRQSYEGNSTGWAHELGELQAYLAGAPV
jgi:uncharacterized protein YndB with AHSA1/START domain